MEKKLLKKRKKGRKASATGARYALLLLIVMGVAVLAGATSFHLQHEQRRFPHDWRIAGVNTSGMSLFEARQRLQQFAQVWEDATLTVQAQTADGVTLWQTQIARKQIGASIDVEATLQRAWDQMQRHPPFIRTVLGWVRKQTGEDIKPVIRIDKTQFDTWLRSCKKELESPPRDARIRYLSAGKWEVQPEQAGVRLADSAEEKLIQALHGAEALCTLPLEEAPPRITREHVQHIDCEWTFATTRYSERDRNRTHNVRKAAKSINGIVLLPGDVFSYNEVVGPRTLREGFRRAPVIVRGELVPGDGGGVCQVSTTLYMAALQAGLQIVQRSKHAIPISYAPPGLDATVVYGVIDLRFRNNTPSPIALVAEAKGGKMTVRVLGSSTHKREVRIKRIVHAVVPPTVKTFPTDKLPVGTTKVVDKGQRGWRVSVYRTIQEPGKPPVQEKVGTDFYRPQARVVLVGQGASGQEKHSVHLPPTASSGE
ncbi:MAG: VanW family protein, partial [bacterium]|nr:VanW family protein [bacterium]